MENFDFDGTGGADNGAGSSTARATVTVTDPTQGVTFTISLTATNNGIASFASLSDPAGVGLSFTANNGTGRPIDTIDITITLPSPTAARTAFATGSPAVLNINGDNVTGVVSPGGGSISFKISDPTTTDFSVTSLTVGFTCFCAGTHIATPMGPRAVEDLRPGDPVTLLDGRVTMVRWIGRQRVNTQLAHPAKANPISITAGALGDGLPQRDLRVSQDHAIAIDGHLINAGVLVNGSSIYQERNAPREGFTYYHIETDAHELILAEGVPTETFIDYASRDAFGNANEASEASSRVIQEMPLPRVSSARLVPAHVKQRLSPAIAAE